MNVNIYHKHKDIIITIFIIASRAYLQQVPLPKAAPLLPRNPSSCRRLFTRCLRRVAQLWFLEECRHLRRAVLRSYSVKQTSCKETAFPLASCWPRELQTSRSSHL